MSIEIELKTSVEDHRSLRERISLLSPPAFSFEKDDCYWAAGEGGASPLRSAVRLRRERILSPGGETGEKNLVTYKVKEVRGGIEVNDEREFSVSDAAGFEDLLRRLGLAPMTRKHKQGWAWVIGDVNAELCEVSGPRRSLGWFLELEILAEDAEAPTVAAARHKLLGLLDRVGVPRSRIEERYYSELLA
ncbi:MAG: CYTH domain-containing protein [Treponema sp.]|jgi:adenylate cyclase class 2|nr:CYTH domain-containing protein [Treponema sp.]